MKLNALRDKRNKKVSEARGILNAAAEADRDLTDEEREQYDALMGEVDGLNADITRVERLEAVEATGAAPAATTVTTQPARGPEARTEFETMGEFLHAVRFNPNDQRLSNLYHEGGEGMRSEQNMGEGAAGGFAVPTQFISGIRSIDPQAGIFRPRAEVIPAGTPPDSAVSLLALDQDTADAPNNRYGGVEVNWTAEGGESGDTDAKLREITLQPHEVTGSITVTDRLLRNWGAAGSLLETQLRGAVMSSEDFAFLNGDGVGKPLGMLKANATKKINRAIANKVSYADIVEMVARLHGQGIFYYSKSVLPQLMQMEDTAGHLIWTNSAREGEPAMLAGMPALPSERNPALGTLGDLWCADLTKYLIKDGSGPIVAASEHVHFKSNKTVIKIVWNVDGSPWLKNAFKLENGYEVSPFVALDVPEA